ncbi:MAG: hypothetical protein GY898_23215 [Proteobacteria bacterium]|nr:hypothetical protein [Pseudomonadota bacterium]
MPTIVGFSKPIGFAVVPGGAPGVPLGPCGGIDAADTIIVATQITDPLTANVDLTAAATIPKADAVQIAVIDTTGDFVLVAWQEAK